MGLGSADGVCGPLTSSAKLSNEVMVGHIRLKQRRGYAQRCGRSHLTRVASIDYRVESVGSSTLDGRQNHPLLGPGYVGWQAEKVSLAGMFKRPSQRLCPREGASRPSQGKGDRVPRQKAWEHQGRRSYLHSWVTLKVGRTQVTLRPRDLCTPPPFSCHLSGQLSPMVYTSFLPSL